MNKYILLYIIILYKYKVIAGCIDCICCNDEKKLIILDLYNRDSNNDINVSCIIYEHVTICTTEVNKNCKVINITNLDNIFLELNDTDKLMEMYVVFLNTTNEVIIVKLGFKCCISRKLLYRYYVKYDDEIDEFIEDFYDFALEKAMIGETVGNKSAKSYYKRVETNRLLKEEQKRLRRQQSILGRIIRFWNRLRGNNNNIQEE